jgi:hypothetical protein
MDIVEVAKSVRTPKGDPVNVRVGIHSGPVVAGMIGCKGPRYCVAGTALEISSKLESSSHPLCVQISEETYFLVKDTSMARKVEFHRLKKGIDVGNHALVSPYLLSVGECDGALAADDALSASSIGAHAQVLPFAAEEINVDGIEVPPIHEALSPPLDAEAPVSPSVFSLRRKSNKLFSCFSSPLAS